MRRILLTRVLATTLSLCLASCASSGTATNSAGEDCDPLTNTAHEIDRSTSPMELGNFSVSLAVKDLAASRTFYEKLGFAQIGGDPAQNWLILRNGDATIGLFQGMFEQNILTFNPGWARDGDHPEEFTDVRKIQEQLEADGITMVQRADPSTTGPASFVILDPDGNTILVDQHR